MKIVNKAFCKNTMLIKEQATMDFFLTLPPFFFIFLTAAHFSNIATILLQGDRVCQQLSQNTKENFISFSCSSPGFLEGDLSACNGKLLAKRAKRKG